MSRIEIKTPGYSLVYGRDNTFGLFIEIRDLSLPEEVGLIVNEDQLDYKGVMNEKEFAEWIRNIADDYSFDIDVSDLLELEAD